MNPKLALLSNGRKLSYAEYGAPDGHPVLLLHGLVGSVISEGMEEQLAGIPLRVLALARPGYGASDYFEMSCVADWPRQLKAFLDNLGLHSFDVYAISAGAPYGYALAAFYPDRVRAVYVNSGIPAVCQRCWRAILHRKPRSMPAGGRCPGRRSAGRSMKVIFPSFLRRCGKGGTLWTPWAAAWRTSARRPGCKRLPGDLILPRCSAQSSWPTERPTQRFPMPAWRRQPNACPKPRSFPLMGRATFLRR